VVSLSFLLFDTVESELLIMEINKFNK
jgi:hypothetical protein